MIKSSGDQYYDFGHTAPSIIRFAVPDAIITNSFTSLVRTTRKLSMSTNVVSIITFTAYMALCSTENLSTCGQWFMRDFSRLLPLYNNCICFTSSSGSGDTTNDDEQITTRVRFAFLPPLPHLLGEETQAVHVYDGPFSTISSFPRFISPSLELSLPILTATPDAELLVVEVIVTLVLNELVLLLNRKCSKFPTRGMDCNGTSINWSEYVVALVLSNVVYSSSVYFIPMRVELAM